MAHALTVTGTFDPMAVHVGNLLREVYINSNFKMKALRGALLKDAEPGQQAEAYSEKSIYRHFKEKDLDTSLLRAYDTAFRGLGVNVDLFLLLWKRERGIQEDERYVQPPMRPYAPPGAESTPTAEPLAQGERMAEAAELLRKAAQVLDGK